LFLAAVYTTLPHGAKSWPLMRAQTLFLVAAYTLLILVPLAHID
jgi:hypothetical protein